MDTKTLIVYYSRSGSCEIVAKALQSKLLCESDKLEYADTKRVAFGTAVVEALRKLTVTITGIVHNPAEYHHIIFITPVWGSSLSTPVRSYMAGHKADIASYSLIAVSGKGGLTGTVKDAAVTLGKEPAASAQYASTHVKRGTYNLETFLQQLSCAE